MPECKQQQDSENSACLLLHPLTNSKLVLPLHVTLTLYNGWQQAQCKLDLLRPCQHLVVPEDGNHAIDWSRQVWEVKSAELSRGIWPSKDHGVTLPL